MGAAVRSALKLGGWVCFVMSDAPSPSELISLPEAARRYGLSPKTLRVLAQKGRLKARKMGRDWFTTPEDVQAYLSSRMKTGRFRSDIAS